MQLSRKISTFDSLSICPTRQSRTRIQVLRSGRRLSRTTRPPTSRAASASITSQPRSPRVLAASGPAGPAPTTTTRSCRQPEIRGTRSGCRPRRCSCPWSGSGCSESVRRAYCGHGSGRAGLRRRTRGCPRSGPLDLLRQEGAATDGRAAPTRFRTPSRTTRAMVSGEVKRPRGNNQLGRHRLTRPTCSSSAASPVNRDTPISIHHLDAVAWMYNRWTFRSHRSGSSAMVPKASKPSGSVRLVA